MVAYKLYQGASTTENPYHGSHVACTVCGNDSVNGDSSYYDGMAKDARFYFTDLTDAGGNFVIGTDFTALWDTVYLGRGLPDSLRPIKQHSGSWRWSDYSGTYLIQDASTDAYCWAHKDFMNIFAAGNEGQYGYRTIGNPSLAKDVLTIGATRNGTNSDVIAWFSSLGPTQDGRIKPNVMAPGVPVWSALNTGTNTFAADSGTSMATPAANGTVGLMRCYLQEGYYPTGSPVPSNRITYISSALLRSMAMASADPNIGSYAVPDSNIGWGRIDADSVLYFTGDTRKLIITDDTAGIATGEYKERQFHVASAIPLRVCLAWTDTAAAPNANPTLVNDLDLTATSPGGSVYKGNQYTNGQSTPNPTARDSINVEECVRVNAPDTGLWTIRVSAHNVKTAQKQGFAWTATGGFDGSGGITEAPSPSAMFSLDKVLPNPTTGRTGIRYGLPEPAAVYLSVFSVAGTLVRSIMAGTQGPGLYTAVWDGKDSRGRKVSPGVYLLRLEAGTFVTARKLVVQR